MRTPSDRPDNADTRSREKPRASSKKPYRAPRMVTYGNLRQLALVKGGTKSDGGGPPPSRV